GAWQARPGHRRPSLAFHPAFDFPQTSGAIDSKASGPSEARMRILMTGATGLVGQGVLLEALARPDVSHVAVLGRRALAHPDPRVEDLVVDRFDDLTSVLDRLAPFDACFYCAGAPPLGTPEGTYRHVTLELTLHVARVFAERNPGS